MPGTVPQFLPLIFLLGSVCLFLLFKKKFRRSANQVESSRDGVTLEVGRKANSRDGATLKASHVAIQIMKAKKPWSSADGPVAVEMEKLQRSALR